MGDEDREHTKQGNKDTDSLHLIMKISSSVPGPLLLSLLRNRPSLNGRCPSFPSFPRSSFCIGNSYLREMRLFRIRETSSLIPILPFPATLLVSAKVKFHINYYPQKTDNKHLLYSQLVHFHVGTDS